MRKLSFIVLPMVPWLSCLCIAFNLVYSQSALVYIHAMMPNYLSSSLLFFSYLLYFVFLLLRHIPVSLFLKTCQRVVGCIFLMVETSFLRSGRPLGQVVRGVRITVGSGCPRGQDVRGVRMSEGSKCPWGQGGRWIRMSDCWSGGINCGTSKCDSKWGLNHRRG